MKTSGVGFNTFAGANEIRRMQVGFPVKLTSTYNATTGYSWERLVLEPPIGTTPSAPEIGNKAFTIDDNQSLAVDQTGWLEPSQEATGYIFQPTTAAAASSIYYEHANLSASATILDTWSTIGLGLSVGVTGTYLVTITLVAQGIMSTTYAGSYFWARLYNSTDAATVPDADAEFPILAANYSTEEQYKTTTWTFIATLTAGKSYEVQAIKSTTTTWTMYEIKKQSRISVMQLA